MIPGEQKQLVDRCLSGDSLLAGQFFDFLDNSGVTDLTGMLESVDQSDYSLRDWVEATLAFDKWLSSRSVSDRPFNAMTGYITCCTMANPILLHPPELQAVVLQNLEEYGFEAAS